MKTKLALKLHEIRLNLYRIENEGDKHSSRLAKKTLIVLEESCKILNKIEE